MLLVARDPDRILQRPGAFLESSVRNTIAFCKLHFGPELE